MKVSFEIESFGEVVTLIKAVDQHKVAACIVTVLVVTLGVLAVAAYWFIKH